MIRPISIREKGLYLSSAFTWSLIEGDDGEVASFEDLGARWRTEEDMMIDDVVGNGGRKERSGEDVVGIYELRFLKG